MACYVVVLGVMIAVAMQLMGASTGLPAPNMALNRQRDAPNSFLTPGHLQPAAGSALPRSMHPEHAYCELLLNNNACGAVTGCSWCDSADSSSKRLPSACMLSNFASKLPASTGYTCSASQGAATPQFTDACMALSTQEKCNANATCTWCAAGAIPSECLSKAMASHLPPAVFQCDAAAAPIAAPPLDCLKAQDKQACTSPDCSWCKVQLGSQDQKTFCVPKVDTVMLYLDNSGAFQCNV